jgi:hypothetical protein
MSNEDELIQFEKDWNRAIESNHAEEISRFMSDDWIIIGTEGGITTKEQFLQSVRSGDLHHTKMEADFIRIKIYNEAGVITSRGTSGGTYKNHPFEFYEWSSSTCIRKNKTWSCVLTMLTPAQKK